MTERTIGERVRVPLAVARRVTAGLRARRRHGPGVGTAAPVRPANLLSTALFGDPSPTEAAILSVFMSRETVAAGAVVVRQGDRDGDLYLIEAGRAEVRMRRARWHSWPMNWGWICSVCRYHPYQPRFLDAWTLLATLAGQTARIRLVPDVLNLALRPPAVLARAAASGITGAQDPAKGCGHEYR